MNKVEVFSSDTCKYCVELKDYLKEHNVEYIEYNISRDEEARRNLIKLGYTNCLLSLIPKEPKSTRLKAKRISNGSL